MSNANLKIALGGTTYSLPVTVSGAQLGYTVAVAGTTATAVLGTVKPNSTHFTTDANGFLSVKVATTAALGLAKFSSTYFTVSSGNVTPKTATTSVTGVVRLATADEATAGTDTTKAVTPAGLAAALAAAGGGGVSLKLNESPDLNSARTTGFYYISDLSSCSNAPLSASTQAVLKVWALPGTTTNGNHNWTVQELTVMMPGSTYSIVQYVRILDDNPYTTLPGWRTIPNNSI